MAASSHGQVLTIREVAAVMKISPQAVWQIERKALAKLKRKRLIRQLRELAQLRQQLREQREDGARVQRCR